MQSSSSTTMEQEVQAFLDDPMLEEQVLRHCAWMEPQSESDLPGLRRFISEAEDFLSVRTQDSHPFWVGAAHLMLLAALCELADWDPDLVQPDRLRAVIMEVQYRARSLRYCGKSLRDRISDDPDDSPRKRLLWPRWTYSMMHPQNSIKDAEYIIKAAKPQAINKAYDDAMAAVQTQMATHNIQEDEEMEDMQ